MEKPYHLQLDRAAALYNSGPMSKFLRAPHKLLRSKILEQICRRSGRVMRRRATTFWGDRMTVVVPEPVSLSILGYGFYQENVTRVVLQHLRPGQVFLDVGAQFGFYSLLASSVVGAEGRVHAFEPTRSTFEILQQNLRGKQNVRANNLAVWSEAKTITFNDYGLHEAGMNSAYEPKVPGIEKGSWPRETYEVETVSVDEYLSKVGAMPHFVKVSAQCAEYEILLGMEKVLSEGRPMLALEIGDVGFEEVAETRQLVDYLGERGYQPLEFDGRGLVRHEPRERYNPSDLFFAPR